MPALPPVAGVLKATVQAFDSVTKHNIINRLHYSYTDAGAPSIADLNTAATEFFTIWNTRWYSSAVVSSSVTLQNVYLLDLASSTGNQGSAGGSATGTGAPGMPAQAAVLLNWHIARHYRGGKPKTYLGGISAAEISTDESEATAAMTQAGQLLNYLIGTSTGFVGTTFGALTIAALVNVSYYLGSTNYTKSSGRESSRPTLRGTPVVDTIVTGTVNPNWHTQRRRLLPS